MSEQREIHPVADVSPQMTDPEFAELCCSIAKHGLLEAIWLHPDGRIIDGRHRYKACLKEGVEPRFQTWDGRGSLLDFATEFNLSRKHYERYELAMMAARMKPLYEAEARERQLRGKDLTADRREGSAGAAVADSEKGTAAYQVARRLGVKPRTVERAVRVLRDCHADIVALVDAGDLALTPAEAIAKLPKLEQRAVAMRGREAVKARAKELGNSKASGSQAAPGNSPSEEHARFRTPDDWLYEAKKSVTTCINIAQTRLPELRELLVGFIAEIDHELATR